jgi:predicted TIM-barrel fold metal-dependent hydrolase
VTTDQPLDVPAVATPKKAATIDVVDAQIHMRAEAPQTIAAMDAIGVATAVVDIWPPDVTTTADGAERFAFDLVEVAREQFPGRFAYIGRVDPADPAMNDRMAAFAAAPGAACVRVTDPAGLDAGRVTPTFAAAQRHGVPLMVYVAGHHEAMLRYAREFDELQLVVDHCGMHVGEVTTAGTARPPASAFIDALLAYAPFPNVAVKWIHAPRLSRQEYPFADVLEQLARTVEAFGPQRVMWGSDHTVTRDHHTYAEALFYVRETDLLSTSDKEWVLGRTARQLLQWPAA